MIIHRVIGTQKLQTFHRKDYCCNQEGTVGTAILSGDYSRFPRLWYIASLPPLSSSTETRGHNVQINSEI